MTNRSLRIIQNSSQLYIKLRRSTEAYTGTPTSTNKKAQLSNMAVIHRINSSPTRLDCHLPTNTIIDRFVYSNPASIEITQRPVIHKSQLILFIFRQTKLSPKRPATRRSNNRHNIATRQICGPTHSELNTSYASVTAHRTSTSSQS